MRNFIAATLLMLSSQIAFSAQWLVLTSSNIESIQIVEPNNSNSSPEGLYIALKTDIIGEASSYCIKKMQSLLVTLN